MSTLEQLRKDNHCLKEQIMFLLKYCLAATSWSTNHTAALNNKYQKGTLVWYEDYVYECLVENNSIPVNNEYYWHKINLGHLLAQEVATPTDAPAPSIYTFITPLIDNNEVISILQASITQDGYLSSIDWNKFNNKQNALPIGNSSQYIKGDLTLGTFLAPETTSPVTADLKVGGIEVQEVVPEGTTLQEFIQQLLTTVFNPTIISPSFSLSYPITTREIGSSAPITLTFNFDRGSIVGNIVAGIWQPGAVQGPRAGASSSYTINGVTQPDNTLSVSPVLLSEGNTFNGTVTYGVGIPALDSKGNVFASALAGGTSPSQSTIIQGIYPYFYYKSNSPITAAEMQTAIVSGDATLVLEDSNGTLAIPYNVTGQYMAVAYPNASTAKTKYFVTSLDEGVLGGLTSPFNLGTTLPCNSPNSFWSNISYRIHVSPLLTNPNAIIELRNS